CLSYLHLSTCSIFARLCFSGARASLGFAPPMVFARLARCAKLALRGRFAALRCARLRLIPPGTLAGPVLLVDDPQPLEREERLDALDRGGLVRDEPGEATRRDHARGPELLADALDHRVDHTRGAVEQPRLQRAGRGLPDHRFRARD